MGLLRAGVGALSGVLADSWRDYFYCDALDFDTLVVKGEKRTNNKRSSNVKGSDNIISNGSIVAVADGQCMIIVEQGKIVELCAEPGEFVYDTATEPTIFYGGLNAENIKKSFQVLGKRFTFGGDTAMDQRVYYFNTKEIMGNKFGTKTPIMFSIVVDPSTGRKLSVDLRCNGEYTYKITDPLVFYKNVSANVSDSFKREEIDSTLKSELLDALQPALSTLATQGVAYDEVPAHTKELSNILKTELSQVWGEYRGIEIVRCSVASVSIPEEDAKKIKDLQEKAFYADMNYAAGALAHAQAQAMVDAANNESGAMMGFAGMGMGMQMTGMNAANMFQAAQQNPNAGGSFAAPNTQQPVQQPATPAPAAVAGWTCACGTTNSGKFCTNCGQPQPAPVEGWTCSCGAVNKGKFCPNCGGKKPEGAPLYACDKCGWKPEDPKNPPKFCPECGDVFDEADKT